MNVNIYNVDFVSVIQGNLETFLRKITRVNWLGSLVSPVVALYNVYLQFRTDKIYQMSHNSQVVYLEKVLNDKFDNSLREIRVQNSALLEPVWHYDTQDNKPVFYYDTADNKPVWFRNQADFYNYNSDFEVIIPVRLQPGTPEDVEKFETAVKLLVDYYKLYSKKYVLKYE